MAEYPVMSSSQGTYGRIEQTSYMIRETYEMCRVGLPLTTIFITINLSTNLSINRND